MHKIMQFIVMLLLLSITAGCGKNAAQVEEKHAEASAHGEHEESKAVEQCVVVSEESRKLMGLELKTASYINMEDAFNVTGEIAKDTDKVYHITPKTTGEVTEIKTRYYEIVKKGDVLGTIKTKESSEEIISPYGGMIMNISAAPGQQVDEITPLFTISDLSSINANFDIYEKDAGKVKVGQKIIVKSIAYPDKAFTGRIVFISPRVDENSRTIKIRAVVDNQDYLLKFSMFVNGRIIVSEGYYLAVPTKAIQKVDDKHIVFIVESDKEFAAKVIQPGFEHNGYTQIVKGLKNGDKAAVEGSFLLKSELLKSQMGEGCAE